MDKAIPSVNDLFKQLGLPSSDVEVEAFINAHGPIKDNVKLYEAPCWSSSQAGFLKDIIDDDSEWSYLADELDALLRKDS
ncbi:MAG: hypothetical protein CMP91_08715 [Gammaproteobacteria bacterium]|nr:hypothetical protein [Gammaproteobacteria bacterium]MAY02663.1 hypothetical protein [Gammaproteobacteria bacterium]|tara:strand:+ start:376 stop:615 length:240 start_codon:yes stop_codon:yes gene_type:complete